jgi:hypothetical protein
VSAIATATSAALDAAIPTISVSGDVTTARIASAASAGGRGAGDVPYRFAREDDLASGNSAGPPNVRRVKPRVRSGTAVGVYSAGAVKAAAQTPPRRRPVGRSLAYYRRSRASGSAD